MTTILTFGHGTASEEQLAGLIRAAGIERIIDVRSVPKSRRSPHVWEEALRIWVPERTGADYARIAALGGFRKARSDSANAALRHPAFRGYADYMETQAFAAALDELMDRASGSRTAIMCSESLWWRCHRRLIADAVVLLRGGRVEHLMHDGSRRPHAVTEGARVVSAGKLRYDES